MLGRREGRRRTSVVKYVYGLYMGRALQSSVAQDALAIEEQLIREAGGRAACPSVARAYSGSRGRVGCGWLLCARARGAPTWDLVGRGADRDRSVRPRQSAALSQSRAPAAEREPCGAEKWHSGERRPLPSLTLSGAASRKPCMGPWSPGLKLRASDLGISYLGCE